MYVETSDGVTLHASVQGSGSPILLIHGACVDGSFFGPCQASLASSYLTVSFDRRGYGKSVCSDASDRSIFVQADDALSIIRSVAAHARWDIVAHSAGCLVALELASRYPHWVRQMVLHEPAVFDCLPKDDAALKLVDEALSEAHGDSSFWSWPLFKIFSLERISPNGSATVTREHAEAQESNMRNFILYEAPEVYAYVPHYEAIHNVPCTICTGRESVDTYHGRGDPELARRIGARHVYIAGSHNRVADDPAGFASVITGFLDNVIL